MTELEKKAKAYLIRKGVKKTGDKFIALEVITMLAEFAQEQVNIDIIKRYKVASRHYGCHPETCNHLHDVCVKDIDTDDIIYECDDWQEAERECDRLNAL